MGIKVIAKNKRASYDYALEEKYEAGLMLQGTEVKSLRNGKVTMAEAWINIDKDGEAWIHNMNIPQYSHGNIHNHDEGRKRKLLLHQHEIEEIQHLVSAQRMTIVPTMIYFKGSKVKLEIALGKGKKKHDKREDAAKKDIERKLRQGRYDD